MYFKTCQGLRKDGLEIMILNRLSDFPKYWIKSHVSFLRRVSLRCIKSRLVLVGFDFCSDAVTELLPTMLQKIFDMLKILGDGHASREIADFITENLKVLVYYLAIVQWTHPLAFRAILFDYLKIAELVLTNYKGQKIVKAALLSYLKVLRSFSYYTHPERFGQLKQASTTNFEAQQQCFQRFHEYFNDENIQTIINTFVSKILVMRPEKKEDDDEADLEDGLGETGTQLLDIIAHISRG